MQEIIIDGHQIRLERLIAAQTGKSLLQFGWRIVLSEPPAIRTIRPATLFGNRKADKI